MGEDDATIPEMNAWAAARYAEGDLPGAILGFSRAVATGIEQLGPSHPTVAVLLNNLATIQLEAGNLQAALEEYQWAEKIDRAAFGPRHPKVGDRVYRVGIAYDRLGNREAARACYEEAFLILVRTRGVHGEDTMEVALCLLGLQGDPVRSARADGVDETTVRELVAEFRRIADRQARDGG